MPNSSSLAFKYRSGDPATLERDLASLREAKIYAASRGSLNDPFEGRFDRSQLDAQFNAVRAAFGLPTERIASSFEGVATAADELLAFVDRCGVFSLSYNPLNELVWAHYGGSHQGFCIGYDVNRLLAFAPMHLHRIEVNYASTSPSFRAEDLIPVDSPLAVLQKLLGAKSPPWRYEEEVRILATPPGLHDHDYRAVREIYFGLRCPEETRLTVMEVLAGRGVTYKQVTSTYPSYRLEASPIEDALASAPRYRERVAPIGEGAILPEYLKPELRRHAEYLTKAAEIVRREPYCEEITLVDFSSSKSTLEKPVIFVQYLRGPNKWMKEEFTLPEIDERYERMGLGRGDV